MVTVQSASDSVPYKFASGDFRIRRVAYLATRDADEPCFVLRAPCSYALSRSQDSTRRVCTYGWRVGGSYRTMQSYAVTSRREAGDERLEERKRGSNVRVSVRFPMLVAKGKSTRLEITINLRGRLEQSKLIRFESINKKLNVTWITDYMLYECFLPFNKIIERYEISLTPFKQLLR